MPHAKIEDVKLTPEEQAYTNKDQILSIVGSFFALAATIVLLRIYVRIGMLRLFGADDYIMVAAMGCGISVMAFFLLETEHGGIGKHAAAISPDELAFQAYIGFYHNIFIMLGASLAKMSVGMFLLRLAQRPLYRRTLWGMIIFLIIFTLACAGTLIFQCVPVQAAWDMTLRPPMGDAKCYSLDVFTAIGLFNSSINIATDVVFALFPVPLLWHLQVNRRTKASLVMILSLGFFACIAAIIKCVKQATIFDDPDWSVNDWFHVWFAIEVYVGITAASLPTLKPLFAWALDTARALTTNKSSRSSRSRSRSRTGTRRSSFFKGSLGYSKQNESVALENVRRDKEKRLSQMDPYHAYTTNTTSTTATADSAKPSGPPESWGTWYDVEADKRSDSSVMPMRSPSGGIMRTTEVTVA